MTDNITRINEHPSDGPPPVDDRFLELLTEEEQADWQNMECWTYLNDGERASPDWGEGPSYLGFRLVDWVELADKSPRLIEICGMRSAIDRWRVNHPDPEQSRKAFEDDGEPPELTEQQRQRVHNMTADIPEDDPERDFLVNLAELMVTAKRDDEGMEAMKADIAREQAELPREPY